jgi:hypothetical protein
MAWLFDHNPACGWAQMVAHKNQPLTSAVWLSTKAASPASNAVHTVANVPVLLYHEASG